MALFTDDDRRVSHQGTTIIGSRDTSSYHWEWHFTLVDVPTNSPPQDP